MDMALVEQQLNSTFLKNRVFVGNGSSFAAEEPGWFRITFAYPLPILEEGLARIITSLKDGPKLI